MFGAFWIGWERRGGGHDYTPFMGKRFKTARAPQPWTLSMDLEHASRQAYNITVFLKTCFSQKMAYATKWYRNAGSFKLNRFMPLSQPIYRKQCLLHFELRGCIVSKNKKEKSPCMLEICLWCHLILQSSHLNLEAFILHVNTFTCDLQTGQTLVAIGQHHSNMST